MTHDTHDVMMTWVSLVHAGTFFPAALSEQLQGELQISLAEQDFLKQLDVAGGRLKLVDLAARIYLSKAGVTKMVDRLEAAGMVSRKRSELDRRVVYAELTERGKNILGRSKALLLKWVRENFGQHLSARELSGLHGALRKLLEAHDRWEGQMAHLGR